MEAGSGRHKDGSKEDERHGLVDEMGVIVIDSAAGNAELNDSR